MDEPVPFPDRATVGRLLADRLARMELADPVVLALPRGGVPVGLEIARKLAAPLDLLIVRKIGVPWQPELAAAAIVGGEGEGAEVVRNDDVMRLAGLDDATLDKLADKELREIARRRDAYLAGRAPIPTAGRTAILVDDGIATGATVRAALIGLRRRGAARLVLAVPVAPRETLVALRPLVDDLVCLTTPEPFYAIGGHYRDFHQVGDDEVVAMLDAARGETSGQPGG